MENQNQVQTTWRKLEKNQIPQACAKDGGWLWSVCKTGWAKISVSVLTFFSSFLDTFRHVDGRPFAWDLYIDRGLAEHVIKNKKRGDLFPVEKILFPVDRNACQDSSVNLLGNLTVIGLHLWVCDYMLWPCRMTLADIFNNYVFSYKFFGKSYVRKMCNLSLKSVLVVRQTKEILGS